MPQPLSGPQALEDLAQLLRDLRSTAGSPSHAEISRRTRNHRLGPIAKSTIQEKLSGISKPTLDQLLSIVHAIAAFAAEHGRPLPSDQVGEAIWRERWSAMDRAEAQRRKNRGGKRVATVPVPTAFPRRAPGRVPTPVSPAVRLIAGTSGRSRETLRAAIGELADTRAAHGGLSIAEVEDRALSIVGALATCFEQQIAEANVPLTVTVLALGCTFDSRPYRVPPGRNALKIQGEMQRPAVRIEITPVVGIARNRDAEHVYIVMDANRPTATLLLTMAEAVSDDLAVTGGVIDCWAEQRLCEHLVSVAKATRNDVSGRRG